VLTRCAWGHRFLENRDDRRSDRLRLLADGPNDEIRGNGRTKLNVHGRRRDDGDDVAKLMPVAGANRGPSENKRLRGFRAGADRAIRAHNLSGSGPARLVQDMGMHMRPMGAT